MKASFFEFGVATSGLFLAKNALNVAGHNIANSKTEGYSRQVALLKTSQPLTFYNGKGMVGTGAEVYGVGQIRSSFLDQKYWKQNSVLGEYSVKSQQLGLTEAIFNSISETGMTATIDNFFSSLQDLTTTSNDKTYRSNVLQTAQTLATQINSTYKALEQQQEDLNQEVKATVNSINSIGLQIRDLNEQISKYEMDGSNANDLRDQRARLLDKLSSYVNATAKEVDVDRGNGHIEKRYIVQIDGTDFVNHYNVTTLGVKARSEKVNPDDEHGLYDVVWTGSGQDFNMYSSTLKGELKALVDLRDGNNNNYMNGSVTSINPEMSGGSPTGRYEVTISDPSKIDLLTEGKISLTDPTTKRETEFTYEDFVKNADGSVTFTIKEGEMTQDHVDKYMVTGKVTTATSGETCGYKGIPYYMERLNELSRGLARAINEGLDYKGNPIPGVTPYIDGYDVNGENNGYLMFTYADDNGVEELHAPVDYTQFTAKNFQVSSFLLENPDHLAASDEATSGQSNNNVILNFSKIKNFDSLFREGSINDYTATMTASLAIDLKQAKNFESSYTDVVTGVSNQRLSVMGVDISEETTNILQFQELYNASAKLISVIDGIYDTLINLGR